MGGLSARRRGLAISKQIVGQMQGRIGVESELRKGSTLRVEMTLNTVGAPGAGPVGAGPSALEERKLRLLNSNPEMNRLYGEKMSILDVEAHLSPTPRKPSPNGHPIGAAGIPSRWS